MRNYSPKNLLFALCLIVDAAVAYVGVAQQGVATEFKSDPGALAMRVTCSAGNYGAGNVDVDLQTSHDGVNWVATGMTINFTADATKELEITAPILPFLRFAYKTAGSATIKSELFSDVDPAAAAGIISTPTGDPVGGLRTCRAKVLFDTALAVPIAAGGSSELLQGNNVCAAFAVIVVAGRTVGDVTTKLQQLPKGSAVWEDTGDAFATIQANSSVILPIAKRLGSQMRLHHTPANGFDGNVTTFIVHDGVWNA